MASILNPCPICELHCVSDHGQHGGTTDVVYRIRCLRCGEYFISERAAASVDSYLTNSEGRLMASSSIRISGNPRYLITLDNLKKLAKMKMPDVHSRAVNILTFLARRYPRISQGPIVGEIQTAFVKGSKLDQNDIRNRVFINAWEMIALSWSIDYKEIHYLLFEYLIDEMKVCRKTDGNVLEITPKGWMLLGEMAAGHKVSNVAFIAMKFDDKLVNYSKSWFEPAITAAGYEAKAMYNHKHGNLIDNEMKALIRRSRFIVCDMTENSRGAYYEAGFAHGIGLPVIFLCESKFFQKKESELGEKSGGVHFDTNHYPYIEWDWERGKDLMAELNSWIIATIGLGLNKQD